MTLLFGRVGDDQVREAAWVARCVGRADTAPFGEADLSAPASYLTRREAERGRVLFAAGKASQGVWIIRGGMVELTVGAGARRLVIQLLHPGDVDGDVELLLGMPFPYTARAVADTEYLFLEERAFERLLREHPRVARRWLSSVAIRVAGGQRRIVGLLGKSLPVQVARLLIEEAQRRAGSAAAAHPGGDAGRAPAVAEQGPQAVRAPAAAGGRLRRDPAAGPAGAGPAGRLTATGAERTRPSPSVVDERARRRAGVTAACGTHR